MKVRVLRFDLGSERDRKFFELMYEGFMSGASLVEKRNLAISRSEARVLDKLDPVSVPREQIAALRQLRDRPGEELELQFEPQDYELIGKYLEMAPWGPVVSRNIRDLDDWFRAAPTVDKE